MNRLIVIILLGTLDGKELFMYQIIQTHRLLSTADYIYTFDLDSKLNLGLATFKMIESQRNAKRSVKRMKRNRGGKHIIHVTFNHMSLEQLPWKLNKKL
jgi:hypothetical protein